MDRLLFRAFTELNNVNDCARIVSENFYKIIEGSILTTEGKGAHELELRLRGGKKGNGEMVDSILAQLMDLKSDIAHKYPRTNIQAKSGNSLEGSSDKSR